MVYGLRIQDLGHRVQGLRYIVEGLGFRIRVPGRMA